MEGTTAKISGICGRKNYFPQISQIFAEVFQCYTKKLEEPIHFLEVNILTSAIITTTYDT